MSLMYAYDTYLVHCELDTVYVEPVDVQIQSAKCFHYTGVGFKSTTNKVNK